MKICVADDPVVPHSCSCGEEAAASLINAGLIWRGQVPTISKVYKHQLFCSIYHFWFEHFVSNKFIGLYMTMWLRFGPTAHEINRSEMVKSWLEEKLPLAWWCAPKTMSTIKTFLYLVTSDLLRYGIYVVCFFFLIFSSWYYQVVATFCLLVYRN